MSETQALVSALKKALKAHGLTYRQVAQELDLSEASVKRLFADGSFSLERFEQICALMAIQMGDLVRSMEVNARRLTELSVEQERELVSEPKLLLIAFLVVNAWSFEQILAHYKFAETEVIRYLVKLDRLKMIELLPKNRIKLLIAPNFAWRKNGPIQNFFMEKLHGDYFQSEFNQPGETLLFLSGMLSVASAKKLGDQLQQIAVAFNGAIKSDSQLSLVQRSPNTMVLALRPWKPATFQKLRK